jgi:hypothetical protein
MNTQEQKFHFTVGELIEVLKTLPENLPVIVSGYESGYENFFHPYVCEMKHEPENPYYEGEFQKAEKKDKVTFDAVVLQRIERSD